MGPPGTVPWVFLGAWGAGHVPGAGDRGSTLCGEVKVAIGVKKELGECNVWRLEIIDWRKMSKLIGGLSCEEG